MARPAVRVRPATEADLPELLALADQLRDQVLATGPTGGVRAASRSAVHARYLEAIADPERTLLVAVDEADVPLGMALLTVQSANALLDLPAVHMSHAVVADRHRRRGAGRALVAAALTYAEERGLEQVVASVSPGSRDANRFFARLGFAPLAVRRVASVATVRRRLPLPESRTLSGEHVVRVRPRRVGRLVRGGLPLGPSPVTEVDERS